MRNDYAVSEVMGTLLVILIATSVVSIASIWSVQQIEDKKATVRADRAAVQFQIMNDILQNMMYEGVNSSMDIDFETDAGYVSLGSKTDTNIDSLGDRFVIYYSVNESFDFNVTGFDWDYASSSIDCGDPYRKFWIRDIPTDRQGGAIEYKIYSLYDSSTYNIACWPAAAPPAGYCINFDLIDTARIDIINCTYGNLLGRIWLFDLGILKYQIPSPSGIHNVIYETSSVIRSQSDYSYIFNEPKIYQKDNSFVMRMMQINRITSITAGGGPATYNFKIKLNNSFVRENKIDIPKFFKIQIHGNNADTWIEYFTSQYGFIQTTIPVENQCPGSDLLYHDGEKSFSLIQSIFDIDMEMN